MEPFNCNQTPMNNMNDMPMNQFNQPDNDLNMRPVSCEEMQNSPGNNSQEQSSGKKQDELMDVEMEKELYEDYGAPLDLNENGQGSYKWIGQEQTDPNMEYTDISTRVLLNEMQYQHLEPKNEEKADGIEEREPMDYDWPQQQQFFSLIFEGNNPEPFANQPPNQPTMGPMNSGSKQVTNIHVLNFENDANNH